MLQKLSVIFGVNVQNFELKMHVAVVQTPQSKQAYATIERLCLMWKLASDWPVFLHSSCSDPTECMIEKFKGSKNKYI